MSTRVALVGCGAVAEIVSRRAYRTGSAGPRVVAAIDPDPARAELIASLTGARPFADLPAAVRAIGIDAADIRTPHHTHADLTLQALELGLHVLVEKPVSTSVQATQELVLAAARTPLTVSVGENYGLLPAVERAAALLKQGAIGAIVSVRATRAFEIGPPWLTKWRLDGEWAGSGVIVDQCCHQARMLRSVVGEIHTVQAAATASSTPGSAPDVCVVNLVFASGSIGQMLLAWGTATPAPGPELQVFGTDGSLEVHIAYERPGGGCVTWRRGIAEPVWEATGFDYDDSLDRVIAYWGSVLAGSDESRITLGAAVRDLAVTEAVLESLRTGQSCRVSSPTFAEGA